MPAADPATIRARPARGAAPQRRRAGASRRSAGPQIRWDRLARGALVCVLAALLYLYLSAGVHLFSSWRQERRDESAVRALQGEHARLAHRRAILSKSETVELQARRLGMARPGEQSYVISGLPGG